MRLDALSLFVLGLLAEGCKSRSSTQESWLVPRTPIVASQKEARDIPVSLLRGDDLVATEERRFESSQTARVFLIHDNRTLFVDPGQDGALPFVHLRMKAEGGYLFVVDLAEEDVELPRATFDALLHTYALDSVLAERARRGEVELPGRERRSEYLKAFIEVGSGSDESFDRGAGQALELLPGNDPVDMRLGHSLEMRLESHGKALRGARVLALSRAGADVESTAYETDDNGMLFVKIDRRGFWLIRAAQMTRCEGCMDADWVSAFTSYTFDNEGGAHKTTTLPPTMSSTRDASLPRAVLVVSLLAAAGAALVRSTSKRVQKNPSRAPGS